MNLFREIIVDNFAGGGGASTGIELATGRSVDIAINHDPDAIAMHKMNHPDTEHYCESVWEVNPREVVDGRPVALCWLSPDCKHFSKAKGSAPINKNVRGLAWVAVRWAATVKPRVIMLENVEEFKTWGPVVDDKPCPKRKGNTFKSFVRALERQGYNVEFKELVAADYGAPTIRKRLFMIARRDGQKIVWPKPTHYDPNTKHKTGERIGNKKPWRTAAEIIDWSIPCKSIFNRKKPLAEKTMQRIAKGLQRFVIDSNEPFIVPSENIAPFITEHANASKQRNMALNEPLRTICASVKGGHFALVSAHLVKFNDQEYGHSINEPMRTVTSGGINFGVIKSFLVEYYGNGEPHSLNKPLHTITTRDRFALVTIKGIDYQIVDIGMRMLEPHELFAAQDFPRDYIISVDQDGKKISKKNQVARCGNSVCPSLSKALVEANLPELCNLNTEVAA